MVPFLPIIVITCRTEASVLHAPLRSRVSSGLAQSSSLFYKRQNYRNGSNSLATEGPGMEICFSSDYPTNETIIERSGAQKSAMGRKQ
jgi:hypothetical protein